MKNLNFKTSIKKTAIICVAFLAFVFPGCSDEINTQDNADADQSVAVVEENETENPKAVETVTVFTYIQPVNTQRNDGQIVIDASSTSFKNLDMDKNKIVNAEEFYDGFFKLKDGDGDNSINEVEFNKEENFLSLNNNAKLNSFTGWDTDGNKMISKEELRNKLSSLIDIPNGETLAQNLYIVWDTDNDDKVEKLELENVVIRFDPDSN